MHVWYITVPRKGRRRQNLPVRHQSLNSALSGFGTPVPDKSAKLCQEVSEVIFASLRFVTLAKKLIYLGKAAKQLATRLKVCFECRR
jgi:hypothetical protein